MTQKIADDFADISARLRELERRTKVLEDPQHLHRVQPEGVPFQHHNYMICPACQGKGSQWDHSDHSGRQLPIKVACHYCNGSGTVVNPAGGQP